MLRRGYWRPGSGEAAGQGATSPGFSRWPAFPASIAGVRTDDEGMVAAVRQVPGGHWAGSAPVNVEACREWAPVLGPLSQPGLCRSARSSTRRRQNSRAGCGAGASSSGLRTSRPLSLFMTQGAAVNPEPRGWVFQCACCDRAGFAVGAARGGRRAVPVRRWFSGPEPGTVVVRTAQLAAIFSSPSRTPGAYRRGRRWSCRPPGGIAGSLMARLLGRAANGIPGHDLW